MLGHAGLPAADVRGNKQHRIDKVNHALVNYFFGAEEIRRKQLRKNLRCTIEHIKRGSVVSQEEASSDSDWENGPGMEHEMRND